MTEAESDRAHFLVMKAAREEEEGEEGANQEELSQPEVSWARICNFFINSMALNCCIEIIL